MDQPIAISIRETADLLRCSVKHVYQLIKTDPEFPRPWKLGRATRILRAALVAWIGRRAEQPPIAPSSHEQPEESLAATAGNQSRQRPRNPTEIPTFCAPRSTNVAGRREAAPVAPTCTARADSLRVSISSEIAKRRLTPGTSGPSSRARR